MARITDLVDENGELLYPISVLGAIYKDNQTAEQWVEGLNDTLNTKIDTHVLEDITSENGVHGIRYYNDVLSYKNMFGEWVEITTSGGNTPTPPTPTETPLGEPTNVSLTNADESVVIMWSDPEDVDTSVWNGTVVVRKEGSAPTDKSDGTIVVDSRTRNQYATSGYTDTGLTNGTEYFYGIFPYTTNETYTNTYTTSITPSAIYPSAPTNVSVEAGDSQISISFTTPSDATGTRIVWGTSAPTDENDGNIINNVNGSFTITGLTNGNTYYVRVYSYNAKHRFTGSDVVSATCEYYRIVTWADGTYEEISAMLTAHYNGYINISDYWSVGDVRTIPLSAMSATGVGETQPAQNAEVVIIGFGHDDLVNPINGKSKAALSLQLKNGLEVVGYMYSAYNSPSYSLWDGSPRRTWCNSTFKNALPAELVSLIKTVTKKTWRYAHSSYSGYRTQQTTNDDCFLISEFEVFGVQGLSTIDYGAVGEDGTQYEYYKTSSNRIKYLGVSGTSANTWWLRSSYVSNGGYSYFRSVNASGSVGNHSANSTRGVAPGFCI